MPPVIFPPPPPSREFQAFPPVSFSLAICNYERLVIFRTLATGWGGETEGGGTRGVQPHFRARNAPRGLNIIPREYVTRVNLRPRTPSRSTGLRGGGDIFRLKCSYVRACRCAGKSVEPAENSRSRESHLSLRLFLFFPRSWPRRYFTFSPFSASPHLPRSSESLLPLRLCLVQPGRVRDRSSDDPRTKRPPAASLDERHPRDDPRRAAPAPSPTPARGDIRIAGYGKQARASGFYSELTLTGFAPGIYAASRSTEETRYCSFGENRQDDPADDSRRVEVSATPSPISDLERRLESCSSSCERGTRGVSRRRIWRVFITSDYRELGKSYAHVFSRIASQSEERRPAQSCCGILTRERAKRRHVRRDSPLLCITTRQLYISVKFVIRWPRRRVHRPPRERRFAPASVGIARSIRRSISKWPLVAVIREEFL